MQQALIMLLFHQNTSRCKDRLPSHRASHELSFVVAIAQSFPLYTGSVRVAGVEGSLYSRRYGSGVVATAAVWIVLHCIVVRNEVVSTVSFFGATYSEHRRKSSQAENLFHVFDFRDE